MPPANRLTRDVTLQDRGLSVVILVIVLAALSAVARVALACLTQRRHMAQAPQH
ncbi:hypothetical protein BYT27DRAFT_7200894 [Phlegmacium glaucopus]|nr:hypothetical protein BYT27DRAFT_7200894 [Phlegmacium glaucopus]